ncbi:hypothetical protein JOF56_006113 [Kibdelosporangium banguiense]|uniref:Uncharacterized protein n=1 Tax=Kibdelosporangium banguiense TaxID=1365924 RepID=A0ABS4TMT8_9PSEU|nr:hypothetical protein [Kibdelosporangium banguiense]MBP2325728.1 hypothetical protein [Kibdelosporangium banguiense]
MRGFKRVLAASGVALAAFSLTGTSAAVASPVDALGSCSVDTDGHTWAWAKCDVDKQYRVVVDYCRVSCSREYGPWAWKPNRSNVNFPTGGTIILQAPEIRP